MNIWHDMAPERIAPDDFIAVVEIPKGSKKKYELDKQNGLILLDRVLHTSTQYPATTASFPVPTATIRTLWTCCSSAVRRSSP